MREARHLTLAFDAADQQRERDKQPRTLVEDDGVGIFHEGFSGRDDVFSAAMPEQGPDPLGRQRLARHAVGGHQSGRRDYSAPIWTLLMFEAFLKKEMQA